VPARFVGLWPFNIIWERTADLKVRGLRPPAKESVREKGLEDVECNVNAGMPQVIHKIGAPHVIDINVVIVAPANWPSLIVPEPIAVILEAVIPTYKLGMSHVERVAMAKMLMVIGVRNAAIIAAAVSVTLVAVVATVVTSGLSAL